MRTFNAICAAIILALFLSIPVYADGTDPGDQHNPGKASCVTELPKEEESTGSAKASTIVYVDLSLSAVTGMLWTVALVF